MSETKIITIGLSLLVVAIIGVILGVHAWASHDVHVTSRFEQHCTDADGHVLAVHSGGGDDTFCIYGKVRIVEQ